MRFKLHLVLKLRTNTCKNYSATQAKLTKKEELKRQPRIEDIRFL